MDYLIGGLLLGSGLGGLLWRARHHKRVKRQRGAGHGGPRFGVERTFVGWSSDDDGGWGCGGDNGGGD